MQGVARSALKRLCRPELFERRAYLNGSWVERGETMPVIDPATGERIADVVACVSDDVDTCVRAAREAFLEWRCVGPDLNG